MGTNFSVSPFKAYRRAGKLVLEIDELRFCADAFFQSRSRIFDRDAFLEFACEEVFTLLHDDDDYGCEPTWWLRFAQALGDGAANRGAGVRLNDGTKVCRSTKPPELFLGRAARALLEKNIKDVSLSA